MRAADNLILFAVRLGATALRCGHISIGIKRILYPVGYWRYPVFRRIQSFVAAKRGLRILDIGSPKLLALWLAAERDCDVLATDYQDSAIFQMWSVYYQDLMRGGNVAARDRFRAELQDARQLSYADGSFDLVYSVSVIEHIPEEGDSIAMKEIARVLRPGGTAVIEVPFATQARDTYVHRDVYGNRYDGTPIFYQRHYDSDSVEQRLVTPSGLRHVESRILGERLPFEGWWSRLPEVARAPVYWLEWIAAATNFRDMGSLRSYLKPRSDPAMDITVVLEKT